MSLPYKDILVCSQFCTRYKNKVRSCSFALFVCINHISRETISLASVGRKMAITFMTDQIRTDLVSYVVGQHVTIAACGRM